MIPMEGFWRFFPVLATCAFCESCLLDLEKQRQVSVCYVRLLRELSLTGQVRLFVHRYTREKVPVLKLPSRSDISSSLPEASPSPRLHASIIHPRQFTLLPARRVWGVPVPVPGRGILTDNRPFIQTLPMVCLAMLTSRGQETF
jgi:hypothetical protein